MTFDFDTQCINTIGFLAVDAIQKAKSGHPGLPLDAAIHGQCLVDTISPP